MSYFLAPSLVALRDETNARFAGRDTSSDGWIGDPSHAARKSSHNPDWDVPPPRRGIVRATDTDIDDNDPRHSLARELVAATVGDPRVWYVIHKFPNAAPVIWSRTYDWQARAYGGHPHDGHVHVSLIETAAAEYDTSSWYDPRKKRRRPQRISLEIVREQMLRALDLRDGPVEQAAHVRRFQRALVQKTGIPLELDGYAGKDTLDAFRRFERRKAVPGAGRPAIPDRESLPALTRGTRFRPVIGD